MNQDDLNEHLVDKHSNELCSIGEEEIELVIEPPPKANETTSKRKQTTASSAVPSKKQKQIEQSFEGVSYIEYEEVEPVKPEPKSRPAVKDSKSPSTRVSRVKMSQSEIDRLKKEGKIIVQDGVLIMKS